MEQLYNSTIAAISTAMSNSGIGIVRMSGPEAFQIADRVYKGKKEETGKELNRLDAFCRDFAWHKQFIAEKAFYFKGFLESLHGESERAAKGKLLTSPRKEV